MYTVYRITNIKNKMYYIGSSNNVKAREREHFSLLKDDRHTNWKLQADFKRYGIENFLFEIIIDGFENRQQMILKEYELINKDFLNNYNIDRICPILDYKGKSTSIIVNKKSGSYLVKNDRSKNWKNHPNNKKKKVKAKPKQTKHADSLLNKKKEREERQKTIKDQNNNLTNT